MRIAGPALRSVFSYTLALLNSGRSLCRHPLVNSDAEGGQSSCSQHEAGGLVLGYRKGAYLHAVDVTQPRRWDRQSRTSFYRSEKIHGEEALSNWHRSLHTVDWIGDWHSHPGFSCTPSATDLHNWNYIVGYRNAPMIFPICDGKEIALYLNTPSGTEPLALELHQKDARSC